MNPILDLTNVQNNSTEATKKDNKNPLNNVNNNEVGGFNDILKKKVDEKGTPTRLLDAVNQIATKDSNVGLPSVSVLPQDIVDIQTPSATQQNLYLSDEIAMCKDIGDQIAQRVFGNNSLSNRGESANSSSGVLDIHVQHEGGDKKLSQLDLAKDSNLAFNKNQNISDINVVKDALSATSETQLISPNENRDSFGDGLKKDFIESLNTNIEKSELKNNLDKPKLEKDFTINTNNLKKELNKVLSSEAEKLEIGNRKEIKITVRPSYLGEIKIDMQKNADGVKILIVASNENVSNLLTQHKSDILAEAERFIGDGDSSSNGKNQSDSSSYEPSGEIDKEDEVESIEPELTITSNFTYYN